MSVKKYKMRKMFRWPNTFLTFFCSICKVQFIGENNQCLFFTCIGLIVVKIYKNGEKYDPS